MGQQMTHDLLLVYLDRGQLPEAVTLVLRPKWKIPDSEEPESAQPPRTVVVPSEVARCGVVDDSCGGLVAGPGRRLDSVGAVDRIMMWDC